MVMWVFGYGSLIWKPNFEYDERVVGYVRDYKRAFHQACIDFRGTLENPGRTLTLEPQEGEVTWGVAYRVTADVEQEMCVAYLDQRERTYDVKAVLDLYTESSGDEPAIAGVLTYIATPDRSNSWYLGPAPLPKMAAHIARSYGPAGPNYEYLFRLEESLLNLGEDCLDTDTAKLAHEVRVLLLFRPEQEFGAAVEAQNVIQPAMGRRGKFTDHSMVSLAFYDMIVRSFRGTLSSFLQIEDDRISDTRAQPQLRMGRWLRSNQKQRTIFRFIRALRSRQIFSSYHHKLNIQNMRCRQSKDLAAIDHHYVNFHGHLASYPL